MSFTHPLLLLALTGLPALWWLLRAMPPRPRQIPFTALRLLDGLISPPISVHTPWWLLVLRIFLAGTIIFAFAGLVWQGERQADTRTDPIVMVVDNGWASAPNWDRLVKVAQQRIESIQENDRKVMLLPSVGWAENEVDDQAGFQSPEAALAALRRLVPRPEPARHGELAAVIGQTVPRNATAVWFSAGYGTPGHAKLIAAFDTMAGLELFVPEPNRHALMMAGSEDQRALVVIRPSGGGKEAITIEASDDSGVVLERIEHMLRPASANEAGQRIELKLARETMRRVVRFQIAGQPSAGAVVLADNGWDRRLFGLIGGAVLESGTPLLAESHYLRQAITARHDHATGRADDLILAGASILVLLGQSEIRQEERAHLLKWVRDGGMLLRFPGDTLRDELLVLPTIPRPRILGGSLSWDQPGKLAAFPADSPFTRLAIGDNITVSRHFLADLKDTQPHQIWAELQNGAPLVVAKRIGKGQVVQFLLPALPSWSKLPISGLFVQMIERLAARAARREPVPTGDKARLQARFVLDGFGIRREPSGQVGLLPASQSESPSPLSRVHPPGLYGDPVNGYMSARNLGDVLMRRGEPPEALQSFPLRTVRYDLTAWDDTIDFTPWLILMALLLLAVDVVVVAWRRGSGSLRRRASPVITVGVAAILSLLIASTDAKAQNARYRAYTKHDKATETVQKFRLAYIRTGDAELDRISERGLQGLSNVLTTRTTVEPGAPIGVDPGADDLSLLPFLYWPSPKIGPNLDRCCRGCLTPLLAQRGNDIVRYSQ